MLYIQIITVCTAMLCHRGQRQLRGKCRAAQATPAAHYITALLLYAVMLLRVLTYVCLGV